MIVWIGRTLALAIHDRQLAEHGGGGGVRDDGLLDSALARPQQLGSGPLPRLRGRVGVGASAEMGGLADLAASLAFGLARNHPFVDGNKRTAHVAYRVFIALNGGELVASDEEKYVAMLGLAEGSLGETEFADWLRPRIKAKHSGQVQEKRAAYRR
ncbi:type II toxin-antitoxin system death-on-curing family toxin [Pseudoxanthomonas putridarboris]|uniref:Type II toxin-antitoxin system death-on-curing family toxin n=1 Tax=Pseudoxanthomonas putridarboris TaxID=752605 RepID=A0ABU9J1X4_9GAMM